MAVCPSCGAANRDEARFCDSCGARLAETPPVREVRKAAAELRDGLAQLNDELEEAYGKSPRRH